MKHGGDGHIGGLFDGAPESDKGDQATLARGQESREANREDIAVTLRASRDVILLRRETAKDEPVVGIDLACRPYGSARNCGLTAQGHGHLDDRATRRLRQVGSHHRHVGGPEVDRVLLYLLLAAAAADGGVVDRSAVVDRLLVLVEAEVEKRLVKCRTSAVDYS